MHGSITEGDRGKTIEIDKSMFGNKRKYNCGRISRGMWVFGMVERGSRRAPTFRVPNRTRENPSNRTDTAVYGTGTMIISNKFLPYFNLNHIGIMVNHSENFVRSIHRRPHKHHRGTLESGEEETEGDEWDSTNFQDT